jgi:hypothetical protein
MPIQSSPILYIGIITKRENQRKKPQKQPKNERKKKDYDRDNGLPNLGLNAKLFRRAASSFARRFTPDDGPPSSTLETRLELDSMDENKPWFVCLGGQVCCVSLKKPGVAGDMAEKSKLKLKLYSESSLYLFVLEEGLALIGVFGALEVLFSLTLLLGLMRLKSSMVSSKSVGARERRVEVLLLWPMDDDNDDDEDVDDVKEPLTLARARGCILFLRLAPPRGMMVLST